MEDRLVSIWCMIWLVRGCKIFCEAEYSVWERLGGLIMAIPPNRAGRASRSRSKSLGDDLLVRAGMKWNH